MSQFEQPLVDEQRLHEVENKLEKYNEQLNGMKWALIIFIIICLGAVAVQYFVMFNYYDGLQDDVFRLMHRVDKIENILHI